MYTCVKACVSIPPPRVKGGFDVFVANVCETVEVFGMLLLLLPSSLGDGEGFGKIVD